MKKSVLLSIVLLMIGFNSFANQTWLNPLQHSDILGSVYFTDARTGYTIGKNRIILKTIDAGLTWTAVSKMEAPGLSSFFFTKVSIGGDSSTHSLILNADDHEKTWERWLREFMISINLFVYLFQAKVMS